MQIYSLFFACARNGTDYFTSMRQFSFSLLPWRATEGRHRRHLLQNGKRRRNRPAGVCKGKNREIWNRGGTSATSATSALPQSCGKYNILDNSLIINNGIKSRNDCGSCGSCGSKEDSTTSENFGTVSFQTTFSEKTGQNVLCRFLKCKE